ncbi:MAG: hypothetical protein CSA82_00155, partial [Actinobacteria bacterium]
IFINASQRFNFKLWFLEKIGLKTYKNTTRREYIDFLEKAGLEIVFTDIIKGHPTEELVVICKKTEKTETA